MSYWKTITTYLVDWSPTWIKTVELSNWIWKAIIIPRARLKDVKQRQEVLQPAIYFLFWKDENWNDLAYIWEAENLINRIWNHDTNKDFWELVIWFISKDNNLTKADVKYLEANAIERAKKANRYILQNWVEPIPNNLPEYQISTMDEFLDNIDLLISSIWYPILKEIKINFEDKNNDDNLYIIKARWANWKWILTDEWFIVLKWSYWPKVLVDSMIKNKWYAFRNRPILIQKWIMKEEWENIVFLKDYVFNSPSASSDILVWRSTNGWLLWKNKDWKTLDEVERKNLKDN